MRCNPRHHSLAIAKGPHTSLHHISFEMRGIDEYMRGSGRVIKSGARQIWGPVGTWRGTTPSCTSRPARQHRRVHHRAGGVGRDTWHPSVHDFSHPGSATSGGTAAPMDEVIAKETFNEVDNGVFVAPPV